MPAKLILLPGGENSLFCRSKKRRTIEKAAYAISARQKERIRRGAETFIARHPQYAGFQFRFDAVLIRFPFPSGIWKTSGKSEIGFSGEKLQPERYKQNIPKSINKHRSGLTLYFVTFAPFFSFLTSSCFLIKLKYVIILFYISYH